MKVRFLISFLFLMVFAACISAGQTVEQDSASFPENVASQITPPEPTQEPANASVTKPASSLPAPSPELSPTRLPTWEWPRSTPEEQGLSSDVLAAMLVQIKKEERPIHSVLVLRHGVLVLEAYVHPFNPYTRHGMYSVTKSITSILVGIAQGQGLIGAVNTPVYPNFPDVTLDDPRKKDILIEHLLTMSSGIEWYEPLYSGLSDLWGIHEADDPAQYFFNPALITQPGSEFNYNSGGSHLLSMLVQTASGKKSANFADEYLFTPLEISDVYWREDLTGHNMGGTGLELLPVDMAKIGQMYLDKGQWQGKQIVPQDWVIESTRVHSHPSPDLGYGYQWWVRPQGDYYALGWGGQQIHIFPKQDLAVVFTAGMSGLGMLHNDLVDHYIIPSVKSEKTLPANMQAQARLETAIKELAQPQHIWPSNPASPLAKNIDGKKWLITGRGTWSLFSFHFINDEESQFDLTIDGDPMPLTVGMDGIYRVTETSEIGPVALVGYWEKENVFCLMQQNLREADRRLTRIQFDGDMIKLFSQWFVEPYEEESEGQLFGN